MDIEITYSDVLAQSQKLSSFEGRESVSPTGETRYPEVHITEQDADLIDTYTTQGLHELEQQLGRLVASSAITSSGNSKTFKITVNPFDATRINKGSVSSMAKEAVSAYVMYSWCGNKLPTRVQFYSELFVEMCKSLITALTSKRKPLLT